MKDDDGRVYKPPGYYVNRTLPQYIPILFKDLPVTFPLTQMNASARNYIPKINRSFHNLIFSPDGQDHYYILGTNNAQIDIKDSDFKNLYREIVLRQIDPRKIWEQKWKDDLQIEENEWENIWSNVHDNISNYQIQSSMWELIHRNYMCAYFVKLIFNKSGNCKLCGKTEFKRMYTFS